MTSQSQQSRHRLLGGGYSPLLTFWRAYRPRWLWALTSPVARPTLSFVDRHGLTVLRGPFAGMRYPPESVGHVNFLAAKLIGSYESELAPVVAELVRRRFRRLVNIGAGEGFYAVGFALASPETEVHAFEASAAERDLCRRLAALNRAVVHVSGRVTAIGIQQLELGSDTLLLADIEGAERELLRPEIAPGLVHTTLLVELHPTIDPAIPEILATRFRQTHDVRLIHGAAREPGDYPEDPDEILLSEGRGGVALWGLYTPTRG